MEWRKKPKRAAALLTACAGVFLFSWLAGRTEEKMQTEETEISAEEIRPVQPELPLSEAEALLYSELYEAMEAGDLVGAARILNENEEQFKVLFNGTLEEKPYLYYEERTAQGESILRMRRMDRETAGFGLVLTRFNTAFFGNFVSGKPEGECLAIQTVILDYPRFTYASGSWKDGKMNGEGVTGYEYYDGKPEGSFETIKKSGTYADNLADGELIYEAGDGNGNSLHWTIETSMGVTVLDERWLYYGYSREYMLPSEEDEDRAYVIAEDAKDAVRWNNLILWEEGRKE